MDLGLDKRRVSSLGALESVVVERFLSCSDREGFLLSTDCDETEEGFRGDLEEEQRSVNRLVTFFRRRGEVKKMGVGLSLRSREEERGTAMGERGWRKKNLKEKLTAVALSQFPNTKYQSQKGRSTAPVATANPKLSEFVLLTSKLI